MFSKPSKRTDRDLYHQLNECIYRGNYVFLQHAKQRLVDRGISDLEVLDILEGKKGRKRKRNKSKDKYEKGFEDWKYCIEGVTLDAIKVRVIISFQDGLMPIITVIRLK
ncbi:MAG: hypothetical protein P1U40_12415 [Coxiellaceae bacterium]|nr:hypothetical protein [Coxiellaceae bacterium]